ncbi:Acyl-CoA synthetase (AMP-forming)/AMP-acid ligase II [Novosphingobium sp. CF614]|uniref:class I adenylate-forming enzyme family protein n=1 Tax=Novosphingobium sp. CF614 TaxID=1884364 RepID=UPI0008F31701|nr:fatty acid--CoA ligase family protein [Novosphingobium sp. CF614]SFF77419.1 Acyl-CoA synthetase (AMP-forming)/AMP-acid ligase II [Novosphingobium sp. CF614]
MSTLSEQIHAVLALDPAAPAIEFHKAWTTWGELAAIMAQIDSLLEGAGLPAGTRVGVMMRNNVLTAAALLEIVASDRCIVTLNANLPDERLAADIIAQKVPVVVGMARDWEREPVRAAVAGNGCAGIMLGGPSGAPAEMVAGLEQASGADLLRSSPGIVIEMLSSGTTGTPKRIPLKATSFAQGIDEAGVFEGRGPGEPPRLRRGVLLVCGPFTHLSGVFNVVNCVASGRQMCLLERFTVDDWVDAVRRHKLKVAWAPPSGLRMILDAGVPKADLESLVTLRTGTAPVDPKLAEDLYDRYELPLLQNYGATEFAGAIAGWTLAEYKERFAEKKGAVGKINRGVKARIVDPETGAELPFGEVGLLELRSAQLGDEAAWVRTSDLAVLDADDYLWIKGRHDNAIIRGGFKVQPDDVVRAMESHPAIREACVVGLPDERLGQVPAAAYVLRRDAADPSAEELQAFLKQNLLAYQVPVRFLRLDEFPRTPSMKVSQPELKALFGVPA